MFVVSTFDELEELFDDLVTMPLDFSYFRTIYHFLDLLSNTVYVFGALSEEGYPTDYLEDRLHDFEQALPPRCSYCSGSGFSSSTSTTCPKCNGIGIGIPRR